MILDRIVNGEVRTRTEGGTQIVHWSHIGIGELLYLDTLGLLCLDTLGLLCLDTLGLTASVQHRHLRLSVVTVKSNSRVTGRIRFGRGRIKKKGKTVLMSFRNCDINPRFLFSVVTVDPLLRVVLSILC